MPDGSDANSSSRHSTRIMPGAFSPSPSQQRRRSGVPPRRTSSAPDLRGPPSPGTTSTSSDEPASSGSSRSSRSSYSPRTWRPHEAHEPRAHIAPLPPTHLADRVQPGRSTTEPVPMLEHIPHGHAQPAPTLESAARTLEEVHRVIRELQSRDRRRGVRGLWVAARGFFGYGPDGSAARRDMVSLIGKMAFGAGQIGATIAMLFIAGRDRSPTQTTINEWQACRRPLGVWCAIWCVRVVLGCAMAVWGYRRKTRRPADGTRRQNDDAADDTSHASDDDTDARPPTTGRRNSRPHPAEVEASRQISAVTFARLTTLLSLLSLTWFVTAHILIYTSVHTCRLSAPHLWWLTFGIICIGYLVIVEVIVVAFIVFILGPLIFLVLNLILICMGRHPLRHPTHINPEVGKLPHKAVDRIPLVLYIPAPVPKERAANGETPQDSSANPDEPTLAVPEPAHVHSYPPVTEKPSTPPTSPSTPVTTVASRSRRLFTFRRIRLRRKRGKYDTEKGKEKQAGRGDEEQAYRYEDKWERGEYPFVKLEGNRAACAICLCDFDEPRRVRYSVDSRPPAPEDLDRAEKGMGAGEGDERAKSQAEGGLKLEDAGEGAQPLRLLACAHVFHKSCLDPWLTEVSGRCPVCQRPVEVDDGVRPGDSRRRRREER